MHADLKAEFIDQLRKRQHIIEEYERNHQCVDCPETEDTIDERELLILKQEEYQWYCDQYDQIQSINDKIFQLRLDGGEFTVFKTSRLTLKAKTRSSLPSKPHFLRISPQGRFFFLSPQHRLMSVRDVDELQAVRHLNAEEHLSGGISAVRMDWTDGKTSFYRLQDADELVQLLGAHLVHYNRKKANNIEHLRKLLTLKEQSLVMEACSETDRQTQQLGVRLLLRLWRALLPGRCFHWELDMHGMLSSNETIPDKWVQRILKDDRWKWFGFQRAMPSSDLRGMGLLGLWMLVFIAERAAGVEEPQLLEVRKPNVKRMRKHMDRLKWMRESVESHASEDSDAMGKYPLAASGINVASMVLHQMINTTADLKPSSPSPFLAFLSFMENTRCNELTADTRPPTPPPLIPKRISDVHANVEYVFEVAMDVVERVYRITSAGYMDFPFVLKRVQHKLQQWIYGETKSVPEVANNLSAPMRSLALNEGPRKSDAILDREERIISLSELWSKVSEAYPI